MWKYSQHLHANNITYATWAAALSFFAPIKWWLIGCLFFVFADFVTGLWVARRNGTTWSSKRFRESIAKAGVYLFTLICARVFSLILPDLGLNLQIDRWSAAFICGIEFYSILENFYEATGNRVFYILTQFTSKKLKDATGVDLEQDDKKC